MAELPCPVIHTQLGLHFGSQLTLWKESMQLLKAIRQHGSLNKAAKAVGKSYKGAWDQLQSLNALCEQPLVETSIGGSDHGGTRLTTSALELISVFDSIESHMDRLTRFLNTSATDFDSLEKAMGAIIMKASARNQFIGTVARITRGVVTDEVTVSLAGQETLVATITCTSTEELGLMPGSEVVAFIKAAFVMLVNESQDGFRFSGRNRLRGKVESITRGELNAEVVLLISGDQRVAAIVTHQDIADLELRVGSTTLAVFQPAAVILGARL